jgi:hypothetical protein
MTRMNRRTILIAGIGSALLTACGRQAHAKATIEVYKSATCGCCGGWVEGMREHGYAVNAHNLPDLDAIKRQHRIPKRLQSCHTSLVDGYVIEGHVPAEVVDDLLRDRPTIGGIALPGMPAGSLGMPGRKDRTWTVFALSEGKVSVFKKI